MSDSPNSPSIPTATKPEFFRSLKFHLGSCFSNDPIAPPPNPLIIVISEASEVGKDAAINKLQQVCQSHHFVVTAMSLPMRPTELTVNIISLTLKMSFLSMVEKDELLEHALVYGDYKGIPKKQIQELMSKGYDIVVGNVLDIFQMT